MPWVAIVGGVLVTIAVVVLIVGYALPVNHVASVSAQLNASPERVWATITDVTSMPEWRLGVESVTIVGQRAAGLVRQVSGSA